jgi:hypothetical protein
MSILTWAMSDNAPIDPELPDAVKAWNEHYTSPKLIITSVKQFFNDLEKQYKNEIPSFSAVIIPSTGQTVFPLLQGKLPKTEMHPTF